MNKQTQQNLLNLVKNNYEKIADQFNQTRQKHLEPLWSELVKAAKSIESGSKIFDIGCGNGRLIKAFFGKQINYLGVDNNKNLIEAAKKNFPDYNFQIGDILDLGKIPDMDFDYVFCIAVLHHLPGEELQIKALKQIKNKLVKNGKAVITVWNMWSQKRFFKLIWKYYFLKLFKKNKMDFGDILFDWKNSKGENISQRYYHAFTAGKLRSVIKKSGLKIEKLYKDKFNYYAILKRGE